MKIRLLEYKIFVFLFVMLTASCSNNHNRSIPKDFVFLTDIDPTIIEYRRYYTKENFLGRQVPGYNSPRIMCTRQAAENLKKANEEFKQHGYQLVVYDAYRPQRAVDEFVRWSTDMQDQSAKPFFYPRVNKEDVFKLRYVAAQSGHTRGSTVDLTLIKIGNCIKPISLAKTCSERKLTTGEVIPFLDDGTVDMGSSFDLFHAVSSHDSTLIKPSYLKMRNFLRSIMLKHGFHEHYTEWWHYNLGNEPYPDTYFDFVY